MNKLDDVEELKAFNEEGFKFDSYDEMHNWSVNYLGDFWESILQYFKIKLHSNYHTTHKKPKSNKMYESKCFIKFNGI